jgi:carbon storage regulator
MLIITRKEGESVILNDNVEVVVVSIEGSKIRLGFNAPSEVTIHRKEVYERIQQANKDAAINKDKIKLPNFNTENL